MGHGHRHLFEHSHKAQPRLIWSLVITLLTMTVEFVGGWLSGSVALISDAWHMFTHAFAIAIGLAAVIIARQPVCHHKTFGLLRAEVVAAFVNGLFLVVVSGLIIHEAIERMLHPQEILSYQMIIIAIVGLVVNIVSIFILHGQHKHNMNVKGVFLHMIADAASSVGVLAAAFIIGFTNWTILDPLVSISITILILIWAWGVLRDTARVLLEMAPKGMDGEKIIKAIKKSFPEIEEVTHPHLWTITPEVVAFTAHVHLKERSRSYWPLMEQIKKMLHDDYHIIESTLQIMPPGQEDSCVLVENE